VSELDENSVMLRTFSDVYRPQYLQVDSRGDVLAADSSGNRILLLNSELRLERILVNTQLEHWNRMQLYFNERTLQLYITQWYMDINSSNSVLSLFSLQ